MSGSSDAKQSVKQRVQDAVATAQREFEAAKAGAKAGAKDVKARAQTPPAKDADEAAQQVRDLRARLDQDIAALEARIPPRDTVLGQARAVGGAVVGGLGLLGVLSTLREKRKEKKEFEAEADKVARAIARHLPAAVADLSPPPAVILDDGEDDEDGGGGAVRLVVVLALLASAAYAVWTQMRDRAAEPDIWGPSGDWPPPHPTDLPPPTAAAPADPTVPSPPPTPPAAPGTTSTTPASNEDDLFGNRPPAP